MNSDDPLRRRLSEAAARIDSNPVPGRVPAVTARVEAHRARTRVATASAGVVGVAALGVGIALAVQGPPATPPAGPDAPSAPAPTQTPSEPASEDPGEEETTGPDPSAAPEHWSTPIAPTCGTQLAPGDLDSAIVFADPPATLSPSESFPVTVSNPTDWTLHAELARYDAALPVLVDETGTVVAVGSLEPVLNEGHSVLALDPGDSVTMSGTLRWTPPCDGDEPAGDPYDHPVPEGDYELYLLASTAAPEGDGDQLQGGPFPVRVDASATHEVPAPDLEPGAGPPECGADWDAPDPADLPGRIETAGDAPPVIDAGEQTFIDLSVTFPGTVAGADVYPRAHLVTADGTLAGPLAPAHDQSIGWYAGAGTSGPLSVLLEAVDCEGAPLPAGDYEVVYSLHTISAEGPDDTLALSEPVPVTVE